MPRLLRTTRSTASLPESSPLRRTIRAPLRPRRPVFAERFDDRGLVYDCFWHADGERILLVGPPPMNLASAVKAARHVALPSRAPLHAAHHASLSVMVTALAGVPAETTAIEMHLGDDRFDLPVQPNHAADLAGRRVLFAMSRDNDPGWIAEWARWHARLHGTDAVILFDNGSTRYTPGDIEEALLAINGLAVVAVPSWPGLFGMADPAVRLNPYWAHFLQIAAMSVALRRFAPAAVGLLNLDIDELAATHSGRPVYDHLADSRHGLVVFPGRWMEAVADAPAPHTHRHFTHHLRDLRRAETSPAKWLLDPKRQWVARLDVHPYWHWVAGRPWRGKSLPPDAFFRHFKALNTGWKEDRTSVPDSSALVRDEAFLADLARL